MAFLLASRARRAFKQQLGNANHLIITALVGLDAVERGVLTEVPKELHAAWSPKDARASASRSRRLVLDMALVRAVDAIDVYIRESIRKPRLIQDSQLQIELDKAGLSIFKKLLAIETHYKRQLDVVPVALVGLMVAWRNKSAHAEADDQPLESYRQTIRAESADIAVRFRGLESDFLLSGYDGERPPTFKEVASFINAAHHYVSDLDRAQLFALDQELFLKELIWKAVSAGPRLGEEIDHVRWRHIRSIWGRDRSERSRYVQSFLRQHGVSFSEPKSPETSLYLDDNLVAKLIYMTPSDTRSWLASCLPEDAG